MGNDGTVQILNEKLLIKNRISNFLDDLIRRNIIKMKLSVKLKRLCFFLFFLAHNFEIHKTIDSNKIELQDIKNNFLKYFLKILLLNYFCIKKELFSLTDLDF